MGKAEVDNGPNLRAHRVLHRFTEQLDAEVQGAVDAARSRQLAPFESVQRRCEYLLARYVEPVQGRALPKHLLRKPAGLTVGADLVAGLDAVEPHLLDACLRQIQAAIETLRPFDGKPFGRKPVGRGSDRIDARNTRADEEKALERLEQAGAEIVQLFRDSVKSLAAQSAVIRKPSAKPADTNPSVLTPPQLAKEMGVDVDKIYAFIRSNELRATNTAIKPGGRARYRIKRQDAEDFQRRRQNLPPPPPSPRRKKTDLGGKGYY